MNLKEKSIIICSIVRDAERGLRRNIPVVKEFCKQFGHYKVVVYENDSTDGTKALLQAWMDNDRENVFCQMSDGVSAPTIPSASSVSCNPFFSRKRIAKMAFLRNQYLEFIEQRGWKADYLMVVDLDVAQLYLDGILSSFAPVTTEWDAVTAFGYSTSPKLKRRYHDTYALTEWGDEIHPQTEQKIKSLADKYGSLKPHDEWVRVFSAFGGLAIYRLEAVQRLHYQVLPNDDSRVEVRCEHYSLYKQMAERGFTHFYINPAMFLKYQDLTLKIIVNSTSRMLRNLIGGGKSEEVILIHICDIAVVEPSNNRIAA